MKKYTIKEAGYVFMYVSNENPTLVDVYFDDVTMTYTPGNVIQYNEYYPFGLQTSNSWTRTNTSNNYLYNAGNELNKNSGWYEMFYRGYDPALGRMMQVDPYAPMYASHSTYNYALNNPVMMNDPSGGQVDATGYSSSQLRSLYRNSQWQSQAYSSFDSWSQDNVTGSSLDGSYMSSGVINSLKLLFPSATFSSGGSDGFWIKTWGVNSSGEGSKYGDATMLGELLNRYIFVSNISRDHFNSMTNSISQAIHQGQQAFIDNPFGGGLMAFLSGGGILGGGGSLFTSLGGKAIAGRILAQAGKNLLKSGLRSATINAAAQFVFKGFDYKKIDLADVGISALSGDAFFTSGILGGLIDFTVEKRLQSVFNGKDIYQTSLDITLGIGFGGANFLGSKFIAPKEIGGALGFGVDFAIQSYGELFNYTLSNPR